MTVEQALNLSLEEVQNMSRPQLRAAVQTLASAANKRVVRALNNPKLLESPAMIRLENSGGKISTRGKTLDDLKIEYIRAKTFFRDETSTQRGFNKFRSDIFNYGASLGIEDSRETFETWYSNNANTIAYISESEVYKAIYYAVQQAQRRGEEPHFPDLNESGESSHDGSVSGFYNEV